MPNLGEVARAAGVSKATASRALAHPDLVAKKTRERVVDAATRLGFQPNRAARALTTGRTGIAGLLVPTLTNPFFGPLVTGAQRAAEATDSQLLVAVSEFSAQRERELIRRLLEQADGLVLVAPVGDDASLRELAETCPLVLVDRMVGRLPSVLLDTVAGAAELTTHLLGLGHRHLTYISGPEHSWVDPRRRAAMRSRTDAVGARLDVLGPKQPTFASGVQAVSELSEDTTAVLAFNSYVALGALHGLHAADVRVPEQISLTATDDLSALDATTPGVTALSVPVEEAGRLAMTHLHELRERERGTAQSRLPGEVVVRGSTGPPQGGS